MSKGQSHTGSLVEAVANIAVGIGISYVAGLIILHAYGYKVSLTTNAVMTLWFTAVSLVRQFVLRRIFNRLTVKRQQTAFITRKYYRRDLGLR